MRHRWKFASLVAVAGVSCAAALALPGIAEANPFFAKQTGQGCGTCHLPGQEEAGPKGLNPAGMAFKNCGYKTGCSAAPAPVAATSENNNGLANFTNSCPAGQPRWVTVRAGRNGAERDVVLILEPGQRLKVAVSKGSTFAGKCNEPQKDSAQFSWIRLDSTF